jgi:hypothetical protein
LYLLRRRNAVLIGVSKNNKFPVAQESSAEYYSPPNPPPVPARWFFAQKLHTQWINHVTYPRRIVVSSLAVALVAIAPLLVRAQSADLQQKLESEYTLTKATADRSDIVTAGAVLVLQKDNLLMYTATTSSPPTNTYKDGKISQGVFGIATCKWCRKIPGTSSAPNVDTRTFVTGEKFWVTKIDVHDDGVVFEFFSDPISDVRYYGLLKFPYPKNAPPAADRMMNTVAEVIKVQPADNAAGDSGQGAGNGGQQPPAPASPPQQPAMAPIAPPPPPTDAPPAAPKTIALGQTKDQVVAILGQPTKVVKLPTKEIDYYPDMKVIFVNGKVKDVQ